MRLHLCQQPEVQVGYRQPSYGHATCCVPAAHLLAPSMQLARGQSHHQLAMGPTCSLHSFPTSWRPRLLAAHQQLARRHASCQEFLTTGGSTCRWLQRVICCRPVCGWLGSSPTAAEWSTRTLPACPSPWGYPPGPSSASRAPHLLAARARLASLVPQSRPRSRFQTLDWRGTGPGRRDDGMVQGERQSVCVCPQLMQPGSILSYTPTGSAAQGPARMWGHLCGAHA